MEIRLVNKLKYLNDDSKIIKKHGEVHGKKIMRCIAKIEACKDLSELCLLPIIHCHLLTGNYQDHYALTTHSQNRMIIIPDYDPIPKMNNNEIDKQNINKIIIKKIEDYHGD